MSYIIECIEIKHKYNTDSSSYMAYKDYVPKEMIDSENRLSYRCHNYALSTYPPDTPLDYYFDIPSNVDKIYICVPFPANPYGWINKPGLFIFNSMQNNSGDTIYSQQDLFTYYLNVNTNVKQGINEMVYMNKADNTTNFICYIPIVLMKDQLKAIENTTIKVVTNQLNILSNNGWSGNKLDVSLYVYIKTID